MNPAGESSTLFGVGLYSLSDAARYLHVSRQVVSHWVLGRNSRARSPHRGLGSDETRTSPVLVTPPLRIESEKVLTFAHLIELRLVRLFRRQGVSMGVIKAAAQNAARLLETQHPFSSLRLQTDGRSIFAELTLREVRYTGAELDDRRIVQDLQNLQAVMADIVRVYFKDTDYQGDRASRWWLLGRDSGAVLDPKRGFGQPIDDKSGVPLSVLYDLYRAGETLQNVADWYQVPTDAVDAAIELYEIAFPDSPRRPLRKTLFGSLDA